MNKRLARKHTYARNSSNNVNRRKVKNKRRQRTGYNRGNGSYQLGDIKNAPIINRVIRYESNPAQTTWQLRFADVLQTIAFATSATVGYPIIKTAKLRRIKVHVLPDQSDQSGFLTFRWFADRTDQTAYTSLFLPSVPLTQTFVPPRDTTLSWWFDSTEIDAICEIDISTPAQLYLDLHFDYVMWNDASFATTAIVLSGAAFPMLCYPTIGNGNQLTPLGLQTG